MKDKSNNLDDINKKYLKEMESNNKIFEQKIQNLNELMIQETPKRIISKKQNEEFINNENLKKSKKKNNRTRSDNEIQKFYIKKI